MNGQTNENIHFFFIFVLWFDCFFVFCFHSGEWGCGRKQRKKEWQVMWYGCCYLLRCDILYQVLFSSCV